MKLPFLSALTFTIMLCSGSAQAATSDWMRYRGPNGSGVNPDGKEVPLEWDAGKNTKWRVALPGTEVIGGINFLVIREPLLEARQHLIHPFDYKALQEKYDLPSSMADKLPMCGPRGIKGVNNGKSRFEIVPCTT